jgi:hypothetical protein
MCETRPPGGSNFKHVPPAPDVDRDFELATEGSGVPGKRGDLHVVVRLEPRDIALFHLGGTCHVGLRLAERDAQRLQRQPALLLQTASDDLCARWVELGELVGGGLGRLIMASPLGVVRLRGWFLDAPLRALRCGSGRRAGKKNVTTCCCCATTDGAL